MTQILSFPVTNLSCASCAARAERALSDVDGVSSARVSAATHLARLTVDNRTTSPADIAAALRAAGYPAEEDTKRFRATGLTCASCASRMEQELSRLPGVLAVSVNTATHTVSLRTLGAGPTLQDMNGALSAYGYALEPETAAVTKAPRAVDEARELGQRSALAALLTAPVFLVEMLGHAIPAIHHALLQFPGTFALGLFQFVLISLVILFPGRGIFATGLRALRRGAPEMNALVALGAGAAWVYSTVAVFAPGLFPDGAARYYFEAAGVIITLILFGRWLEARAKGRAVDAIAGLADLAPETATVWREGAWQETEAATIAVGERCLVKPGAVLPADGIVRSGASHVNEAMLSGEPLPVPKGPGDTVVGGTINVDGALEVDATRVGADTVLSQITRMVEDAQAAKLPIQRLIDRVTLYFVPVVMGIAALTALVWLIVGPEPALPHALVAAVSVLIIACPCAMGLATPISIVAATGRAAQMGILFRDGSALEHFGAVRAVAFDKTGTLTEGRPIVTAMIAAEGVGEAELLQGATSVATLSEHPLSLAVATAARERGIAPQKVSAFAAEPGLGARATLEGRDLLLGSEKYMVGAGLSVPPDLSAAVAAAPGTVVYAAEGARVLGAFFLGDAPKQDALSAIERLHALGVATAIISGDRASAVQPVAARLGVRDVYAEQSPSDKLAALEDLRQRYGHVAFVGDGTNDAPVLSAADVALSMGGGTEIAKSAADVVLVTNAPSAVATGLRLSRATMSNIRQNLFWAFAYNIALIPVAAGLFYPVSGLMPSPMLASGAMALSSLFVVLNALRLLRLEGGSAAQKGPLPEITRAERPLEDAA
ncbi:MAG: heavy metal translocating P-type ATPase [Pseudomonadota bacterium]